MYLRASAGSAWSLHPEARQTITTTRSGPRGNGIETQSMSGVRPLRPDDIPAVAALRARVFARSRVDAEELERQLEKVFLQNPWPSEDVHALVHVTGTGAVDGFLGLVPRPLMQGGRPLRGAAAAQFMVAPESRGIPGLRLYRVAFELPVDLLFTDVATPDATTLWEHMGGAAALVYGMTWTVVLRPAEHRAQVWGPSAVARAARAAARPVLRGIDGIRVRRRTPGDEGLRTEPAGAEDVLPHLDEFSRSRLHATYDRSSWEWLLSVLRSQPGIGSMECVAVHSDVEGVVGWVVYRLSGRGPAFVYQLMTKRQWEESVLHAAMEHAAARGAVALQGRFDRTLMDAVRRAGGRSEYHGRGILLHARDGDVRGEVLSGSAALTGLDGEWWMGF